MISDLKYDPEVQAMAQGNFGFSADLHWTLKDQNAVNFVFSPFTLCVLLAMVKIGARGRTSKEIEKVARFPSAESENNMLIDRYSKVLASFQPAEFNHGYNLSMANGLFVQSGFKLDQEFEEAIEISFNAEAQRINFNKNNVSAANEINSWVADATNNNIKDFIHFDSMKNFLPSLVLVSGVYFKGFWYDKFYLEDTKKAQFYVDENKSVEVDMMYQVARFPYVDLEELGAHVVAIPYKDDRLRLIIYLPRTRNGLSKVEGFKNVILSDVIENMEGYYEIQVRLPRFRIESTQLLVEPLKKLGLQSMFSKDTADLSGIPETTVPLFVSQVIQKVSIEVSEEESKFAEIAGIRAEPYSYAHRRVVDFHVNHPFAFQIVDRFTNVVLVAGSCRNPIATSEDNRRKTSSANRNKIFENSFRYCFFAAFILMLLI